MTAGCGGGTGLLFDFLAEEGDCVRAVDRLATAAAGGEGRITALEAFCRRCLGAVMDGWGESVG